VELNYSNNNILFRFSPHIFWNCDVKKLDVQKDKKIIIERIIEYGSESDEMLMWKIYNYNTIKKIAVNDVNLNREKLMYMSVIFNIKEKKFKCYDNVLLYEKLQEII
jgi:hypothetical protein